MAGVSDSVEKFNAREQLLSADLMRGQFLSSRDRQNREAARSRSFDCSDPASPSSQVEMLSQLGARIYGVDDAPTWNPTAGYAVDIGAGGGFIDNPSFGGLTDDDSSYLVVRWPTTNVTFANPPGANQRIYVVIATPAMADADSQSRTVLVDPVTRAITASNLFKTSNPLATVSIVQGVAGATPLVPAIPAGSLPLFYVWIKNGDATANNFGACRASWRRASQPFSSMSGVISGMGLLWDQSTDTSTTDSPMIAKGFHRIVLDGEVMEFLANMDSTASGVTPDTANNPFGSAAPATWNKPYYIYAVGGRHNPIPSYNTFDGLMSPVVLVESLTPPNLATNKPTANMTVRGVTVTPNGALYVGLGFVFMNTTHRHSCVMTEDMTYAGIGSGNFLTHTWAAGTSEAIGTLLNIPSISNKLLVQSNFLTTTPKLIISVTGDRGDGTAAMRSMSGSAGPISGESGLGSTPFGASCNGEVPVFAGNGKLWGVNGGAGDSVTLWVIAFNHRVGRFGDHVNP